MIRYALICGKGHRFDGWFRNSGAFDEQSAHGQVVCPECASADVEKALMTPGLAGSRSQGGSQDMGPAQGEAVGAAQSHPEHVRRMVELAKRVREFVVGNADYVGDRFAEEARKIHHDEAETRGIYGEATGEEASELIDEGIVFHPLPRLPEDHN